MFRVYLRGKFPRPKQNAGPHLFEHHSATQIPLDFVQNVIRFAVESFRVREKFVIDDVFLRKEPQCVTFWLPHDELLQLG